MTRSIIYEDAMDFSLNVIEIYRDLTAQHEYVLSKQLLKAATSIGANIKEANSAQSKADFLSKMYIAFKESSECDYWLTLLYRSNYITESTFTILYKQCKLINNTLSKITLTTKQNLQKKSKV